MVKTNKRATGDRGEEFSIIYLKDRGYRILERNYLRKWGEIDIIALKKGVLYFVEVKTQIANFHINSPHWFRPEDNLHRRKLQRIKRTIQSYLWETQRSIESEWEFSAITVILKRGSHDLYRIEHLENLII
jgi:putative endonuclease